MKTETKTLLEAVRDGRISVEEALLKLKTQPFDDLGYAKVDMHRSIRQGAGEVIYGASKTPEQIAGILDSMKAHGQERVLITRLAHGLPMGSSLDYADELTLIKALNNRRKIENE